MSELDDVDARIGQAWAALVGARAVCSHSPNAETCRIETLCERTVDELLERRYEMQVAERVVTA